jgi:hypothetical protein
MGSGNDRAYINQNLNNLVGPEINNIYTSEVPGAIVVSKSMNSNEGSLDIALSGSYSEINVMLQNNKLITDGLVDNVQFTLAWNKGDSEISNLLGTFTSAFMLAPQGIQVEWNGIMYQIYASITPVNLPPTFSAGDKISLLSFENPSGLLVEDRLWITNDEFTIASNGTYYISIFGSDQTGNILTTPMGFDGNLAGSSIHIYPNPVQNGILNIHFGTLQNLDSDILIYDMFGHVIKQIKFESNNTIQNTISVDLSDLNPGAYLIYLLKGSDSIRKVFIVK